MCSPVASPAGGGGLLAGFWVLAGAGLLACLFVGSRVAYLLVGLLAGRRSGCCFSSGSGSGSGSGFR